MTPIEFHPDQVFDEKRQKVDVVAERYLKKVTGDVHHLVPVETIGDGNCLYNSILILMNNPAVTPQELRGIQIFL